MGKLGDLIVRLQLKHEDYKKGLKEAETETKGFGSTLGKIKGAGIAVWAAIGGAALKFANDFVKQSNAMEDKWENFTVKAKTAWTTFVKNFGGSAREMMGAYSVELEKARILTEALQNNTEIENSIKLQKAQMAEELAALEVLMRDQTKSYEERAKAAEKYIQKVSPIYDQEIERLKKLRDANVAQIGGHVIGGPDRAAAVVKKFLIEYGKDTTYAELGGRTFAEAIAVTNQKKDWGEWMSDAKKNEIVAMQMNLEKVIKKWYSNISNTNAHVLTNELVEIGLAYEEKLNGEQTQAIVDALELYETSLGLKDKELKRIYGILNSAIAKIETSGSTATEIVEEIKTDIRGLASLGDITSEAFQLNVPDIIPDDWLDRNRENIDEAVEEAQRLQDVAKQMNQALTDTLAQSLSGAASAFVDAIMGIEGADASQVMAAFLEPFATTAKSLGELLVAEGIAIELAKKTMENPFAGGGAMIAAGVSLIAIGSALAAGIQAIGRGASGSTASSYSGEEANANTETYKSELTVYVEGRISGKDIILSGNKTLNSWNR